MRLLLIAAGALPLALSSFVSNAHADTFRVEIQNISRSLVLTPPLVAVHTQPVSAFALGSQASPGLEALAENGDASLLATELGETGNNTILGSAANTTPITPGEVSSYEIEVNSPRRRGRFFKKQFLTAASMILPSNDGFIALSNMVLPLRRNRTVIARLAVYDSGTEVNDELCSSIPGPNFAECNGPGGGAAVEGNEEGYIHPHAGILGIGDFSSTVHAWGNPVAVVKVTRIN